MNGASGNQIAFCESPHLRGLYMESTGVDPQAETWGSLVLGLVDPPQDLTYRTNWRHQAGGHAWGNALLDFWDDFSADGALEECPPDGADFPIGSLCARFTLPPKTDRSLTFILAWHFPNRYTWTPDACDCAGPACQQNWIGNYYATRFSDAWAAAEHAANQANSLERQTVRFVRAFCDSDLPHDSQGGRALQPFHPALADLLPHGRRSLLRLGGLQRSRRLLPRLLHPCLELRTGHRLPLRRPIPPDARGRVRPDRSG